jgi:hypothetical protein
MKYMNRAAPESTKISSRHAVSDYVRLRKAQDRSEIANMLRLRHIERYIDPVDKSPSKHGFASMAMACLLIETIQSFREGVPDTNGRSKEMFVRFFQEEQSFSLDSAEAVTFYSDVRCGLLHQGETRGGWRIRKTGPLINLATRELNAWDFLREVGAALARYCDKLEVVEWESALWKNCRRRMDALILNCDPAKPRISRQGMGQTLPKRGASR